MELNDTEVGNRGHRASRAVLCPTPRATRVLGDVLGPRGEGHLCQGRHHPPVCASVTHRRHGTCTTSLWGAGRTP